MKGKSSLMKGFTLIEVLIASTVFALVLVIVTQLFSDALGLQRRSGGYQSMQDTASTVYEMINREVRVSIVTSTSGCDSTLNMLHPVLGAITYAYDASTKQLSQVKGGATSVITPADVQVTKMSFCVANSGIDDSPTRVTIPMTLQSTAGRNVSAATVSVQTTIVSRYLADEQNN